MRLPPAGMPPTGVSPIRQSLVIFWTDSGHRAGLPSGPGRRSVAGSRGAPLLHLIRQTPVQLRVAAGLVVLAGIGLALLGLQGLSARSGALEQVHAESDDQVRLQIVRTSLLIADTAAGTDVLLGPDQPRLQPHDYDFALQPGVIGVTIAARQPEDTYLLAVANLKITQYDGQVSAARMLARRGAVGSAASLQQASDTLRTEVLPRLVAVQQRSADRQADAERRADLWAAVAVTGALLAAIVLVTVHGWLTFRTRRMINPPIALAALLAIGLAVSGAMVVVDGVHQVAAVRAGPQSTVARITQARVAAFDARAVEGLGVVQDRVPAVEARWTAAMSDARAALAAAGRDAVTDGVRSDVTAAATLLEDYAAVHGRLVVQDRAGHRPEVVGIATSPTVEGSPGAFEDFAAATGSLLARQAGMAGDGLEAATGGLTLLSRLYLVGGPLIALLAGLGVAARLREYR
jgi:F0F1-type ATP synthase assembly protein I